MRPFSKLTRGLVGQPMLEILTTVTAMEAAGRKVYRFEVGDSDFDAHPHIIEATKAALDSGHTRYVNSMGIDPLRQSIRSYIERGWGFRPDLDQIVAMPSNSVIDFAVRCLVDPGDEVIFPDPGFPSYFAVTNYLGIKDVRVPVYESNGFRLNPDDLEAKITDKTKLIIVNTPQNPTGAVMTQEEAQQIGAIAKKHDLWLLSDEMYSENLYEGLQHHSPAAVDQCRERTIILHGFSKGFSMSGWRLGYAVGPAALMAKMGLMFQTIYSCVPPFIQYAGVSALEGDPALLRNRMSYYQHLRDIMVGALNEIPGISCPAPKGAIYAFPNIKKTGLTSREFAKIVLEKAGVATVPGTCFGSGGEGYVRFCYLREEAILREACEKMKQALAK
ncbi:MAG: pyridoxal phosphate-dependent aminotransferase [Negativicutes bacterium]